MDRHTHKYRHRHRDTKVHRRIHARNAAKNTCLCTCKTAHLRTCMLHTYLPFNQTHTYILSCLHAYIPTCLDVCILAYLHTLFLCVPYLHVILLCVQNMTLNNTASHQITSYNCYSTPCCIQLHSIPTHYATLQYITFHSITLQYITLHCNTITYARTYVDYMRTYLYGPTDS